MTTRTPSEDSGQALGQERDQALAGTRIVLGITGGIAAYKAAGLVRGLRRHGADVRVILTAAGSRFITPLTLQALSGNRVHTDLLDEQAEAAMGHIELARWADRVLIAPASADFLARISHGLADDLLATVCLATTAPIALAPAMNSVMWSAAATVANVGTLTGRGLQLWGPAEGVQACGESGHGRMLEVDELERRVLAWFGSDTGPLAGKRVLITAGPTREDLDPVRFISNRSSGRMGFALAEAAQAAGADVCLVAGPVSLPTPAGVERVDVWSAADMLEQVMARMAGQDVFIACAAVADYRPAHYLLHKLKKDASRLTWEMERNVDILASVAALDDAPFTVGFAAETENLRANALGKLQRKHLDMIAANPVGGADSGFDSADNRVTLFWPGGELDLGQDSKQALANRLVAVIAERVAGGE
jgi:phosphopantothenoylcysteine decarboxylase/phosphopantothenate--cysteine ligase